MKEGTTKEAPAGFKLSVTIHPELRKALRMACVMEDVTITEKVHAIFCHEFERLDLLQQAPATA